MADFLSAISAFENLKGNIIDKILDFSDLGTIVKKYHLVDDIKKLAGDWNSIVDGFKDIENEIKKQGQENAAKFVADGKAFDKVFKKLW